MAATDSLGRAASGDAAPPAASSAERPAKPADAAPGSAATTPLDPAAHASFTGIDTTRHPTATGSHVGSGVTSGIWQAQPTTGATRPAAPPPPEPAPRRRRGLLIAAIVVCVVLGLGAGLWFGRPTGKTPTTKPSATGPKAQPYFIPVFATSPEPGKVTLRFTDMSTEPGFVSYNVFRDGMLIGDAGAGESVPPYRISKVDTKTEHCYTVVALIETTKPPPSPPPDPACLVADGKTK